MAVDGELEGAEGDEKTLDVLKQMGLVVLSVAGLRSM